MSKKFDYLVFIGRFQPFHYGHFKVVEEAFKHSENLIFVIGSHDQPRTPRNPFTTNERVKLIKAALSEGVPEVGISPQEIKSKVLFVPQLDHPYNESKWITSVKSSVSTAIFGKGFTPDPIKIGLIGHNKDHSSYYLKMFPGWNSIEVPNYADLNATDIRKKMYELTMVPDGIPSKDETDLLHVFVQSKNFSEIREEYMYYLNYKNRWRGPFPPTFQTVDAVVRQAGYVLVVERADNPGKGLLALPGGFAGQHETLKQAMLRELREETNIKVPTAVLAGSITKEISFDDPYRSERGRIFTQAYLIELKNEENLPKVKGGDDAKNALWMPLNEFVECRNHFFEDHWDIIEKMLEL